MFASTIPFSLSNSLLSFSFFSFFLSLSSVYILKRVFLGTSEKLIMKFGLATWWTWPKFCPTPRRTTRVPESSLSLSVSLVLKRAVAARAVKDITANQLTTTWKWYHHVKRLTTFYTKKECSTWFSLLFSIHQKLCNKYVLKIYVTYT